jgi:hypothetical protein
VGLKWEGVDFGWKGQFWKERHFRKVAELRDLENSHGCETTTATVCVENSRVVYGRLSVFRTRYERGCDASDDCVRNCCVSPIIAPVFFVIFVLMAQFVLVNVVVAVLMKHLEVSS